MQSRTSLARRGLSLKLSRPVRTRISSRTFRAIASTSKSQISAYRPAQVHPPIIGGAYRTTNQTSRSFASEAEVVWTPPTDVEDRPVTIMGAGVLGRRLCAMWASTGRPVNLYDTNPDQLKDAIEYIGDTLTEVCAQKGTHPGKVHTTMDFHEAVRNSWMVIEAIPEKINAKIALLGRLDRTLPRDCIIATNSSSFTSRELIGDVKNFKERVLNTHYYIPPRNNYVELMSCGETAPQLFPFLMQNMESVGLKPILVPKESAGMIFNRIWIATKREALMVLSEGLAKPADIDALFKSFFHAEKGPCAKMDEVGLDTIALIEKHHLEARPELSKEHLNWLMKGYVNGWALGDKTGSGLYSAEEKAQMKARTRIEDPEETKPTHATGGQ